MIHRLAARLWTTHRQSRADWGGIAAVGFLLTAVILPPAKYAGCPTPGPVRSAAESVIDHILPEGTPIALAFLAIALAATAAGGATFGLLTLFGYRDPPRKPK